MAGMVGAAERDSSGWHQEVQIHVGKNLDKSAGDLDGCASHAFLQGRELLGSVAGQVPGNCGLSYCKANNASLDFSSFFLEISMSQLCQSLSRVKLDPQLVSPNAREASCSLINIPFPHRGTLSCWGIPLGTKQCQPGLWADAGKMKLFVLPFWCFYSQGFFFFLSLCC